MSDRTEPAVTRLWHDRVQLREQERDEALRRARMAEEKVAVLEAENERLGTENAHLKDQNDRLAMEIARLSAQNDRLLTEIARCVPCSPQTRPTPAPRPSYRWKRSGRRWWPCSRNRNEARHQSAHG